MALYYLFSCLSIGFWLAFEKPSIVFPSLITCSAFTHLFLHNSLAAICAKSMLLRENNSNDTLYIARVRTRVEDKVISINETDEMDKADQSDRIGRKTDTGKIAFSCHPNAIRPSCLMPIVRHLSPSLTPSLTSQLAFANKVLIFINIVYES